MQVSVDNLRRSYDLIVVGSGPAGLTLARRYDDLTTGRRTLIVESGARSGQAGAAQRLSTMDASGDLDSDYYALHSQRAFGGTGNIWSGWCAAMEERAFLNGEWPIAYGELGRYYPLAADVLGLPREVHERAEAPLPGSASLVYRPYYVAERRRFNELFSELVDGRDNVDVLFDHTVTSVSVEGGVAAGVLARRAFPESRPVEILGDRIVLACGGIQNARLLQLSLRDSPMPIGSYFGQHAHVFGFCHALLEAEALDEFWIQSAPGYRVVQAIAFSSDFSLSNGLQSATFPFDLRGRRLSNILARSRRVARGNMGLRMEMRPLERNVVALSSSRKDLLGQPAAQVGFKFGGAVDDVRTLYDHLNRQLIRSGFGRLGVLRDQRIRHGGGHLLGTTRMGEDPKLSVTDGSARVHGLQNLYVAGSSLFPATGAANPTFTILALSLRLADHLAAGIQ